MDDTPVGFARRWTELGLGSIADALAPGATMTIRTYEAPAAPPGPRAALTVEATARTLAAGDAPEAFAPLPRITIAYPQGEGAAAPPEVAPDLRVCELLGEGGMGRVYRVEQRSLERDVVVKVLRDEAPDPAMAAALVAEARVAGALEHPRIVPVHALGVDARGRPLIVMKRVHGVPWDALLRDAAHPAWEGLLARAGGDRLAVHLEVLLAACDALDFAHEHGVVHRDVKPDNVLVGAWGDVYLTDWGIAARTSDLAREADGFRVVGTPAYMAPEMVTRELGPADARTDVYLLGATLHAVLTGRPRHDAPTVFAALASAYESTPVAYGPEVPAELASLCARSTARSRAERPASAGAFRAALVAFQRHRGAVRLADEARARFGALREAAARGEPEAAVGALAAECRFGFRLALREWDAHEGARRGLHECVAFLAGRELDRGALDAARALLAELPEVPPALAARVEALASQRTGEQARAHALAREARERDLTVAARPRFVGVVLFTAFVGASSAWAASRARLAPLDLLRFGAAAAVLTGVFTAVAWRRIGTTRIGRQLAGAVVLGQVLLVASRACAVAGGATAPQMMAADLVLTAALFAITALFVDARLHAGGALCLAGAAVVARWPAHGAPVFAASVTLAFLVVSYVWSRWSAAAAARGPEGDDDDDDDDEAS